MTDLSDAATDAPTPRLSKSKLLAFRYCAKRLWLQVYRRELAETDPRTQIIFNIGHRVGEVARGRVPDGILLDPDPRKVDQAVAETKVLLGETRQRALFEAAFQREDMVVRSDILEPDGWGGWRLIEVKSSTRVRPYVLSDVASQAWTIRASGICLSGIVVRHLRRRVRSEQQAHRAEFVDVDVSLEALRLIPEVERLVVKARATLAAGEPDRAMGPHCIHPFRCEFQAYCCQRAAPVPHGGEEAELNCLTDGAGSLGPITNDSAAAGAVVS